MPLIIQSRIYRADLRANPEALYIFGDNERRYGLGGQAAEMRGEPNALGVATLTAPGVFWTEADADRQCAVIDADLEPAFVALLVKRVVIFPLDGIGTGLAPATVPTDSADLRRQFRAAALHVLQNGAPGLTETSRNALASAISIRCAGVAINRKDAA